MCGRYYAEDVAAIIEMGRSSMRSIENTATPPQRLR